MIKSELPLRFWQKIQALPNGCWEWQGCKTFGYGYFHYMQKQWRVHRLAYETLIGPLPSKGNNILDSVAGSQDDEPERWQGGKGDEYPYDEGSFLVMALRLRAYADESGWNSGSHCLVSGYVAEPVEWRKFDRMWKRALRDYDVKAFHAKRFFQRNKQGNRLDEYVGWSDLKAEKFLSRLTRVINQCDLHQVGGGVEREAFLKLPLGLRHLLTFGTPEVWVKSNRIKKWVSRGSPAQPYYFGMVLVLQEARKHADPDTQISFVFDRQEMLQGHAVKAFDDLVADYEREGDYRFGGGISYRSSVCEPPLQAADLLTHAWYEYQTRGNLGWERSEAMRQLTQNGEGMYIHDGDSLQRVLAELPPETLADVQAFEERTHARPRRDA